MTAEEARKLTRESDPRQIEFFKNRPMDQSIRDYCAKVFDEKIKSVIDAHFKAVKEKPEYNYHGRPTAFFTNQWGNEDLKQYAIENGFNISPCGNQRDLIITWDIRQ